MPSTRPERYMSEAMFQLVSRHLVEHFGIEPERISPAATLEDVGLDSMALVELLLVLEEDFGMPMPEDDDTAPRTLGELVERLDAATGGAPLPATAAAAGGTAS
ncbi:phosphopantetheine-binding protein [Streptomyces sp. TR06-5]|uniref:phosphopantetheine-binding protein n=1 Tax=unclassified Streptomyces TaxID=2593676 RepID=UPI00399F3818